MEVETREGDRSRENFTVDHILCCDTNTTTQGTSSKYYGCYGGIVVTGPGIYVAYTVLTRVGSRISLTLRRERRYRHRGRVHICLERNHEAWIMSMSTTGQVSAGQGGM